jgi:hypothetical protein
MSEAQLRVLQELGDAMVAAGDDITKAGLSDEELARRLDMTVGEVQGHIQGPGRFRLRVDPTGIPMTMANGAQAGGDGDEG